MHSGLFMFWVFGRTRRRTYVSQQAQQIQVVGGGGDILIQGRNNGGGPRGGFSMAQVEGAALPLPQGMFSRASSHDFERTCSRRQMHVEGSSSSVLIVSFGPMTLVGFPWVVGDRPMK